MPNLQTYRKGAGEKIPDWGLLEASIYGTDVSRQMMRISMMNMVLHGIGKARVKRANVLSEMGGLTEDDLNRRYKVILSNPPFAGVLPKDSIRHDILTSSKKSELLFLALMMESLAPGGRCAVVVPDGVVSGSTASHKDLRRKLLSNLEVLAVISLPSGVFNPYSNVKTSVLIFRKPVIAPPKGQAATKKLWFYEVKNDGYDPDKIQGGGRPETPEKNDIPGLMKEWNNYKEANFHNPPGEPANAMLPPSPTETKSWWAEFGLIEENNFNLSASSYKPQTSEEVTDEDPADLVRDLLETENKIVVELEKLLKDLEVQG